MGFWLILLTILKIIGIIIASVLVLLLLIASLVLFVPIRYGGKVGFHGKPDISVRVTYLLKMISARFEMHEGNREFVIRIFGIRLGRKKNKKRKRRRRDRKNRKDRKKSESVALMETDNTVNDDYVEVTAETFGETSQEDFEPDIKSGKKNKKNISKNAKGIYNNLSSKIKNISNEINDEGNRRAFKVLRDALAMVLKHIKPQKHEVSVTFGTGDPATTGELLGGIYVFIYMSGINAEVYPDFENKVFEMDSEFKGRIRLFTLLRIGLKTYFNEDVKKAVSRFI